MIRKLGLGVAAEVWRDRLLFLELAALGVRCATLCGMRCRRISAFPFPMRRAYAWCA